MELDVRDDQPCVGLGRLESFKNRAAFLFKDSLKIARIALVDVSTAELMTEDATNADEWGPTPKAMADICNIIFNSEDYFRVVQVLHKRFALNTKKYWRQVHKSLMLLEYLLCHGPEHLVMEFRQDKDQLEELTRFVYFDCTGFDRGSVLQKRAKHVLHLLLDEAFFKQERTRTQKISKGISGFGSQSRCRRLAPRFESPGTRSGSASDLQQLSLGDDSSTLLVDEDDQSSSKPDHAKKTFTYSEAELSSPASRSESPSGAFPSSSAGDSLSASGRSTVSTTSDWNPYEESPTSVLSSRPSPRILDMNRFVSELAGVENWPVEVPPLLKPLHPPPLSDYKCVLLRPPLSQPPGSPKAEAPQSERTLPLQKLPPPPPVAEYKSFMPRSPQRGSRGQRKQPGSVKSTHVTPDLIFI